MHVRIGTALGLPVLDDAEEPLGSISGIFINPDTGVIEGFFVHISHFFSSETLFLPSSAIEHWGSRIHVRSSDALSPLEDFVRLSRLHEEGRSVLGQQIMNDRGVRLGKCADVQFDTRLFRLEWLFPRSWFRWRVPLPADAILEVTPDAVIVRTEQSIPVTVADEAEAAINAIESLASTPVTRVRES